MTQVFYEASTVIVFILGCNVTIGDTVDIRDTKSPNGPTISYSKDEWSAFIKGVKNGEFDV